MKDINPYLIFGGNCRQAMEFYAKSLGAELQMMPYSQAPGQHPPEEQKDKIMHARLHKGPVVIMASDDHSGAPVKPGGNNFWININCESLQEIEKLFSAVGEKGKVHSPLQDMFWGARFGMLTDQFGVNWMFNYELPK
ncbi:MAG TPA: VOC family protein [Candidatus Sulfotelmatobacter sp.]|nr:VOC family protein [Candidatus Sulfotelmatobacter sp.]